MLDNCFYLNREIKQFGKGSFKVEVLEKCLSLESLNERESFWISELNTVWPNGLNANYGGGNRRHSEETKKKISESQKGIPKPEYRKRLISLSLKGRPQPKELNIRRSLTLKGRLSPYKGHKWSPELREKIMNTRLLKVKGEKNV
jgi:group I intron endonuclease